MASAFPAPLRKNLKHLAGDSVQVGIILILVFGLAGILVVSWMSSSTRNFAVAAAIFLAFLGAFVSGNPRLYCLWGLALTLPLALSKRFGPMFVGKPGGEDSFRIEVSDLFLIALAGFLVWDLLTDRRKGLRIPKVTFAWLLLMAIGCAWIAIGPWRTTAAHEVFRMFKVMLLFLVIANELDRPGKIWHCVAGLTLGAIGEAVIALVQFRMKGLIGLEILGETTSSTIDILRATSVQGESVFRPSGLLQHANLLGVYLAVAIPVAIGMLMVGRGMFWRAFFLLAIVVSMPAEVVALSRSAWLSAALGTGLLLAFSLLHPRLRWRSLLVSSVACLVGIAVLAAFLGPITQRLLRSKDDSTVAREIYKEDARRMIASAPWLGHGLNSYVLELPNFASLRLSSYGEAPPAVHNIFYLWWAETGIVGMLVFCLVWGSIIWTGIKNLVVQDELLFVVNAACLAAMIALIPDSFLSFTLRVNTTLRLFWVLAGMILAIRYLRFQERAGLTTAKVVSRPGPSRSAPLPGPIMDHQG